MVKFLHRLFNHTKIDNLNSSISDLNKTLDVYKERNAQLEDELKEYKGYKLKYEVTKLYVDDDEALLELLDAAKKIESNKGKDGTLNYQQECLRHNLAQQQGAQADLARYVGQARGINTLGYLGSQLANGGW